MSNNLFRINTFDPFWADKIFPKGIVEFPNLETAPIFNNAVKEAYENVQAPFELVAMTALSAMSLSVQRGFDLRTPFGSVIPLSIWVLGIAGSGERKDGLKNYFYRGISECDSAAFAEVHKRKLEWKTEEMLWKRKVKLFERKTDKILNNGGDLLGLKHEIERLYQERPHPPVFVPAVIEDVTAPALIKHLAESNGNAAIISSEGGSLLQSAVFRNVPLLNSAWSGSEINVARKGDGVISIKDPRVSLMMLIQPGALGNYLDKKGALARDMGLWARFLVVNPASTQGRRYASSVDQSYLARDVFSMRCKQLIGFVDVLGGREIIEFGSEATETWRPIVNDVEFNLGDDLYFSRARDHASKLGENILRVAAVLHVFEGREGKVGRDLLMLAVKICAYCSSQFMSVFDGRDQVSIDAGALKIWLSGYANGGFRYVPIQAAYHLAPKPLRVKRRLLPAMQVLLEKGSVGSASFGRKGVIDLYPNYPCDMGKMMVDCGYFSGGGG